MNKNRSTQILEVLLLPYTIKTVSELHRMRKEEDLWMNSDVQRTVL